MKCCICKGKIPLKYSGDIKFIDGKPICEECQKKMGKPASKVEEKKAEEKKVEEKPAKVEEQPAVKETPKIEVAVEKPKIDEEPDDVKEIIDDEDIQEDAVVSAPITDLGL